MSLWLDRLKSRDNIKYASIVVGVLIVFTLGVLTGNGHIRFSSLRSGNTGLPTSIDYSSVNQIYDSLRQNYNGTLTESQILDGLKHGLAQSTNDPYTQYFTAKEANAFNSQLSGSFTGIGAQLGQDSSNDIIVVTPLVGSPAAKAGVRAQDIIATIDGKTTSGLTADDAVNKIRGQKGTKVALGIIRNKTQQLTIDITRDDVQIPTVSSNVINSDVGYIQISQFSDPDTFKLAQEAVTKFQNANVKKIIVDLRDNPGGEVGAAVNVTSLWLPVNKLIMQEKRGSTVLTSYQSTGNDPFKGIPTVVLLNAGSASASEIMAAALHDNNAATIIGVKSYGKGVVQQVIPFSDGSELKVTIANWYRPNGQSINKKGIDPDKMVTISDADYTSGKDPQKDAALQFLGSQ